MPNHKGAIYQKKDCNGCKALMGRGGCRLGYTIQREETWAGMISWVPTEPCSKPRTQKRLQCLLDQQSSAAAEG